MNINDEVKEKKNPEALLRSGKTIEMSPHGWSMYPLIVPGRDRVILSPVKDRKLKRLDIVLFRREGSILVIHRIAKCRRTSKGKNVYYIVGDNQKELEGPVKEENICGVVTGIIRKGRRMSVNGPLYKASVSVWMALRPIRPVISHTVSRLKKCLRSSE
ncbi:MAG: S24/S26 family peptidase [Lachnospiraceae bacterium]|nr:S24/S26 family peptidase [Lachnospiraceae bacterium]